MAVPPLLLTVRSAIAGSSDAIYRVSALVSTPSSTLEDVQAMVFYITELHLLYGDEASTYFVLRLDSLSNFAFQELLSRAGGWRVPGFQRAALLVQRNEAPWPLRLTALYYLARTASAYATIDVLDALETELARGDVSFSERVGPSRLYCSEESAWAEIRSVRQELLGDKGKETMLDRDLLWKANNGL